MSVNNSISRLWSFLPLVALPALLGGCATNAIHIKDERVKAASLDVRDQYYERSDLIPPLVATARGFAQQEQPLFKELFQSNANTKRMPFDYSISTDPNKFKQFQQAQDQLSSVLGHFFAVTKNYSDLQLNQQFLILRSNLEDAEKRIATSRETYNETVEEYDNELQKFPNTIWGARLHCSQKPALPFTATAEAKAASEIDLNFPLPQ